MIISVVGHPASGKDTVADYIGTKGFVKFSSSNFIRKDMQTLGIPEDRTSMNRFVSEMRLKFGNSYPAQEIINVMEGDTVIAGFRNTAEIKKFQDTFNGEFKVIAVEAPIDTRFGWAKERGRIGDDITLEHFTKEEEIEKGHHSGSHEVDKVIQMADFTIINNGTKEDLFKKIDDILLELKS